MIRIWGFPTSNGGVNYFLVEDFFVRRKRYYIREFGADDGGYDIDNRYSIKEFLELVKTQNDFKRIKNCVDKKIDNIHL